MPLLDLQQHLKQELLTNPVPRAGRARGGGAGRATAAEAEGEGEGRRPRRTTRPTGRRSSSTASTSGGAREEHEEREYTEPVTVQRRDLDRPPARQMKLLDLTPRQHAPGRGVHRQHQRRRLPRRLARGDRAGRPTSCVAETPPRRRGRSTGERPGAVHDGARMPRQMLRDHPGARPAGRRRARPARVPAAPARRTRGTTESLAYRLVSTRPSTT